MFLFFPIPALTRTVLISLIALLTLFGIMLRPWKVSEAIIALTGAGALLFLGLLSPVEALTTLLRDWNTFFFFLGMMSLSALAEVSGLFDWLAVQAARLSALLHQKSYPAVRYPEAISLENLTELASFSWKSSIGEHPLVK